MKRKGEIARVSGFMRKAFAVFSIFGGGFLGRLATSTCCTSQFETFLKNWPNLLKIKSDWSLNFIKKLFFVIKF